ncbi:hypothetical protein NIES2109_42980 [Nostoc sp. HK-01]|nr:hypothetical protein NIES2109_42980 [Nostoc sp. HK-01]
MVGLVSSVNSRDELHTLEKMAEGGKENNFLTQYSFFEVQCYKLHIFLKSILPLAIFKVIQIFC